MGSYKNNIWDICNGMPDSSVGIENAKQYMQTIKTEFSKVSKTDLAGKNLKGVILTRIVIDEECTDGSAPKYRIYTNGTDGIDMSNDIKEAFQKFIDDGHYLFHYNASQLKSEIPRIIENYLNEKHTNLWFWCMKTHSDKRTLAYYKLLYDLILLVFDKKCIENDISFHGEIHPFILEIKREWVYGNVNDIENRVVCYNELFRRAASFSEHFLYMYSDIFNNLSAMKYESAENKGTIVSLEYHGNDSFHELKKNYDIKIELTEPIRMEEAQYKRIRKLMEISNDTYSLLVNDKSEIFAIGTISRDVERKYYKVSFDGFLRWTLYISDEKFIEYVNMIPRLPDKNTGITKEDIQKYKDTFNSEDIESFIHIVNEAIKQGHGTMVVFAENAQEETERLRVSGICIKPINLCDEGIVHAATSIDGAIICDASGKCFAIGMILDGKASKSEDSSRGARYNSAIRYLEQQKDKNKKTLIVVVSEDGYVSCFSTCEKI